MPVKSGSRRPRPDLAGLQVPAGCLTARRPSRRRLTSRAAPPSSRPRHRRRWPTLRLPRTSSPGWGRAMSVRRRCCGRRLPSHWLFWFFAFAYFFSALLRASRRPGRGPQANQAECGRSRPARWRLLLWLRGHPVAARRRARPLGPRRVMMGLCVAVVGCVAFAWPPDLPALCPPAFSSGVGVGACLMAP